MRASDRSLDINRSHLSRRLPRHRAAAPARTRRPRPDHPGAASRHRARHMVGAGSLLSHATGEPIRNLLGLPGAISADLMMQLFGLASIALFAPVASWGWRLLSHRPFGRELARPGVDRRRLAGCRFCVVPATQRPLAAADRAWRCHRRYDVARARLVFGLLGGITAAILVDCARSRGDRRADAGFTCGIGRDNRRAHATTTRK